MNAGFRRFVPQENATLRAFVAKRGVYPRQGYHYCTHTSDDVPEFLPTPHAIFDVSAGHQESADSERAGISRHDDAPPEPGACAVACPVADRRPAVIGRLCVVSAVATRDVFLSARRLHASFVQYVCAMAVWRADRKYMGHPPFRCVLLRLCHRCGADSADCCFFQRCGIPYGGRIGRCVRHPARFRHAVSQPAHLHLFSVSGQGQMVRDCLWAAGIVGRRDRHPGRRRQFCPPRRHVVRLPADTVLAG